MHKPMLLLLVCIEGGKCRYMSRMALTTSLRFPVPLARVPPCSGKIPMFELENQFDRTLSVEKPGMGRVGREAIVGSVSARWRV